MLKPSNKNEKWEHHLWGFSCPSPQIGVYQLGVGGEGRGDEETQNIWPVAKESPKFLSHGWASSA